MNKIYIFGAHARARTTARYLTDQDSTGVDGRNGSIGASNGTDNVLLAYLIDNDEDNETEIGGIPVIDIRKECDLDTSASVYIGTRGVNFDSATEHLKELGFTNIFPVDVRLDAELRIKYFRKRFAAEGRPLVLLDELETDAAGAQTPSACIFEVRSAYDKPLTKDTYVRSSYERSIQVGADLTDIVLPECEYRDNEGG